MYGDTNPPPHSSHEIVSLCILDSFAIESEDDDALKERQVVDARSIPISTSISRIFRCIYRCIYRCSRRRPFVFMRAYAGATTFVPLPRDIMKPNAKNRIAPTLTHTPTRIFAFLPGHAHSSSSVEKKGKNGCGAGGNTTGGGGVGLSP